MVPDYWSRAKRSLAQRDAVLAAIMRAYPRIALRTRGDAFQTLARSIVGQQISVKAADSVWCRFSEAVVTVEPNAVIRTGTRRLASCGLSRRKLEYVLDLARNFAEGRIEPDSWCALEDEAIIEQLTAVRGIGRWTAEMFLIFNLLRPDVLPVDDLGLQRAVSLHYFSGERIAREAIIDLGRGWQPWRSVATWYLWRSLDPVPVEY